MHKLSPTPICPKREPLADGTCKHQLRTGCCALPDELACIQWPSSRHPRAESAPLAVDISHLRGFTTEDIESFKALRVEVCLQSDSFGEFWLVPAYTGQSRKELTPEHLATVLHALSAFPGSRVTGFFKRTKSGLDARQENP